MSITRMFGRNLNPAEVEEVLDALENLIAWTARVRLPEDDDQWDFVNVRNSAHEVWARSVRIIDGEEA